MACRNIFSDVIGRLLIEGHALPPVWNRHAIELFAIFKRETCCARPHVRDVASVQPSARSDQHDMERHNLDPLVAENETGCGSWRQMGDKVLC